MTQPNPKEGLSLLEAARVYAPEGKISRLYRALSLRLKLASRDHSISWTEDQFHKLNECESKLLAHLRDALHSGEALYAIGFAGGGVDPIRIPREWWREATLYTRYSNAAEAHGTRLVGIRVFPVQLDDVSTTVKSKRSPKVGIEERMTAIMIAMGREDLDGPRGPLQGQVLAKLGIKDGARGTSFRTFERALEKARKALR